MAVTPTLTEAFAALPEHEKDAARDAAAERHGVDDFYDLEPEQRRNAYRGALARHYSRKEPDRERP